MPAFGLSGTSPHGSASGAEWGANLLGMAHAAACWHVAGKGPQTERANTNWQANTKSHREQGLGTHTSVDHTACSVRSR